MTGSPHPPAAPDADDSRPAGPSSRHAGPAVDRRRRGAARGKPVVSGKPVRLAPQDVLRLGLLGIRTRRLRAALSALGISLGIATLIVVIGVPESSRQNLMADLSALGTNTLRAQPEPGQEEQALFPENAVNMVARIGPVTSVSAVANTHATVQRSDRVPPEEASGLSVLASRTDLLQSINGTVREGTFLDASTSRFPTAVLGHRAASQLGFTRLLPGGPAPQVFVDGHWFSVVGILDPTPLAPDLERSVLVGWEPARSLLRFDGRPTVVYVKAREDALEDVRAVLPPTLNPELPGLVQVSRPSDALAAKRATESAFSAIFLGLAGVALLVGSTGVANTMLVSVLERRREIGLRRALGATRGHIRAQFITESVALSALGGAAGTAVGVLGTLGYAAYQGWPPVIPAAAVVGGIAGAALIGVVAGVYPALRASRLTPTAALASV